MTEATTTTTTTPASASTVLSGTTPATSNVGDGTSGTTATTSAVAVEWLPGIESEVSTYISSKGFKDPQSLAKSYMNLEQAMSKPRPFEVPKADDADAWAKIRESVGVPPTPDKYDLGELGSKIDQAAIKPWLDLFHKEGLSSKQAQTLLGTVLTNASQVEKAREEDFAKRSESETAAVLSEWGENEAKNLDLSRRGVAKLAEGLGGLNADELKGIERAIGAKKLMQLGLWLGKQTVEAGIVVADGQSLNVTQEEATRRLGDFKRNQEKVAILTDKRHPKHAETLREWTQLQNVAFGGGA